MASVVLWPPQVSGADSTRAGWPGSNGSTMGTNGAMAAAGATSDTGKLRGADVSGHDHGSGGAETRRASTATAPVGPQMRGLRSRAPMVSPRSQARRDRDSMAPAMASRSAGGWPRAPDR